MYGTLLAKAAGEIENPQVKIEGDPARTVAVPLWEANSGIFLVPQKGLDEENPPDMSGKNGAPLGLLFARPELVPIVNGKPIDRSLLHCLNVDDGRGISAINCVLLSVRKVSEEEYRLYGFGRAAKPLIDVRFTGAKGPAATPVALEIKEGEPALVMVTVFGKYQAKFLGGVVE